MIYTISITCGICFAQELYKGSQQTRHRQEIRLQPMPHLFCRPVMVLLKTRRIRTTILSVLPMTKENWFRCNDKSLRFNVAYKLDTNNRKKENVYAV